MSDSFDDYEDAHTRAYFRSIEARESTVASLGDTALREALAEVARLKGLVQHAFYEGAQSGHSAATGNVLEANMERDWQGSRSKAALDGRGEGS